MNNAPLILVVAAHPDDEVLGCGATIAKLSAKRATHIAILGEGISSRYIRRAEASDAALEKLRADSQAAGVLLGAKSIHFGKLPDNRFDELPLLEVIKQVEFWIKELQPEIIYTHHPGDLNIDHAITFRAVLTATRPVSGCSVREVYAYEIPSSSEWSFQRFEPSFRPNVFENISETIDAKIRAMDIYTSEVRPSPHPRSPDMLRVIARRWGSVVGLEYAEAFELIRSVR